jgi:hypothetical protein
VTRASYLTRREGRYWFEARFDVFANRGDRRRHIRFSLRTGAYAIAVRRMIMFMSLVHELRVLPDYRSRAVELFAQLVEALETTPPFSEDQYVVWRGLELVVDRFVAGAGAVGHAVGLHSPEFWPNWRRFVDRNVAIEAESHIGILPQGPGSGSGKHASLVAATPSNLESDTATDPKSPLTGVLRRSRRRPEYDNGTTIRLIRTYWGEERVDVEYSGGEPEAIVADSTSSAGENPREVYANATALSSRSPPRNCAGWKPRCPKSRIVRAFRGNIASLCMRDTSSPRIMVSLNLQ